MKFTGCLPKRTSRATPPPNYSIRRWLLSASRSMVMTGVEFNASQFEVVIDEVLEQKVVDIAGVRVAGH